MGRVTAVGLTSAHLHYKTSGQEAAQLMLKLLRRQGAGTRSICLGYEILERESTLGNMKPYETDSIAP